MSRGYQLTPSAQRHVDEIGAFIAEDSAAAALRIYDALEAAIELPADNPDIGHSREDLAVGRPLKFWSAYSYLVVYGPASAPLTVVAVLHGARDVEQLLKNIPS